MIDHVFPFQCSINVAVIPLGEAYALPTAKQLVALGQATSLKYGVTTTMTRPPERKMRRPLR
jgi:hypothetical protein